MGNFTMPDDSFDVIIIGGGPGGFTAGLYAARASLKVLLIEGSSSMSQISLSGHVENYPGFPEGIGGFDLIDRFRNQAVKFGLKTITADVTSISKSDISGTEGWEITAGGEKHKALAAIVATGTSWRKLGVPGEDQFVGRGISYCATCDAPFFKDRHVAVVGGGDTAVQEAIYLTNFAKKVTIVHRRGRLRASGILKNRCFASGKIDFIWNAVVEEIRGNDSVTSLLIRDVNDRQKKRELPVDGVFLFIGLNPNTDFLRGVVELDPQGYVVADACMNTSARGIFVCGDCRNTPLRQVVTACGDGAIAAVAAQLYVENLKGEAY
jgi:thioredoxin reductase (NADPH)